MSFSILFSCALKKQRCKRPGPPRAPGVGAPRRGLPRQLRQRGAAGAARGERLGGRRRRAGLDTKKKRLETAEKMVEENVIQNFDPIFFYPFLDDIVGGLKDDIFGHLKN